MQQALGILSKPFSLCPLPELGARDPVPEVVAPAEIPRFQARGFSLRVAY